MKLILSVMILLLSAVPALALTAEEGKAQVTAIYIDVIKLDGDLSQAVAQANGLTGADSSAISSVGLRIAGAKDLLRFFIDLCSIHETVDAAARSQIRAVLVADRDYISSALQARSDGMGEDLNCLSDPSPQNNFYYLGGQARDLVKKAAEVIKSSDFSRF
jgi:hypothetical protein